MDVTRRLKAARRRILRILYDRYLEDPLASTEPQDFFEKYGLTRDDLVVNIHYLHDSGLVELLMGYAPPLFSGARITAKGVDVVENYYEFNARFPAAEQEAEDGLTGLPLLAERFTEHVEQTALDGEARRTLLRDALYLREELARPTERWRRHVLRAVLDWMERTIPETDASCATLLRQMKKALLHTASEEDASDTETP